MNLQYYSTGNRLYVDIGKAHDSYSGLSDKNWYTINGKPLNKTHSPFWYYVESDLDLESVERQQSPKAINHRYEIIDVAYVIPDVAPAVLYDADVHNGVDDNWVGTKYAQYKQLYKRVHDMSEETYAPLEFTATKLGTITIEQVDVPLVQYTVYKDPSWEHEGTKQLDLSSVAQYSDISQMLIEPLLIHNEPCSISSKVSYEIVRRYVKDNINPKCAEITSDYNFCFDVSKRIANKPYVHKTEIKKANGKSYATPKFRSKMVEYKTVPIFEMTNAVDRYSGYTPLAGFKGESLSDLAENVKLYLDTLMEYINLPVHECEHCKGTGTIVPTAQFNMNVR